MEDQLILAVGRSLIELSAQKEELLQAFKKAQERIKQLETATAAIKTSEAPKEI